MRPTRRVLVVALCLAVTAVTLTTLTITVVARTADAAPQATGPVTLVALGDSWAAAPPRAAPRSSTRGRRRRHPDRPAPAPAAHPAAPAPTAQRSALGHLLAPLFGA